MDIRRSDLDPHIARLISESDDPTELSGSWLHTELHASSPGMVIGVAVGLILFYLRIRAGARSPEELGVGVLIFAGLAMAGAGIDRFRSRIRSSDTGEFVEVERLELLVGGGALTRAEQIYCEAVSTLIRMRLSLPDPQARGLLHELNRLLDQCHRLQARADEVRAHGGSGHADTITAERDALVVRLAAAADPETRRSLEQGLALCEERLCSAAALRTATDRLDAQAEMIVQTLGAAHGALVRAQHAANPPTEADAEELRELIAGLSSRAAAVEGAMREVAALGRSA